MNTLSCNAMPCAALQGPMTKPGMPEQLILPLLPVQDDLVEHARSSSRGSVHYTNGGCPLPVQHLAAEQLSLPHPLVPQLSASNHVWGAARHTQPEAITERSEDSDRPLPVHEKKETSMTPRTKHK